MGKIIEMLELGNKFANAALGSNHRWRVAALERSSEGFCRLFNDVPERFAACRSYRPLTQYIDHTASRPMRPHIRTGPT